MLLYIYLILTFSFLGGWISLPIQPDGRRLDVEPRSECAAQRRRRLCQSRVSNISGVKNLSKLITIEKKVIVSMPRSKNGTLVPVPCNSTSIPVSCFFVQEKNYQNLQKSPLTSTPGLHYHCEFWQTKTNVTNSS